MHSVAELGRAIDRALEVGAMTADVIKIMLQEGRESPAKIFRLDGRPQLQDHGIPQPNIARYGELLKRQQERQ